MFRVSAIIAASGGFEKTHTYPVRTHRSDKNSLIVNNLNEIMVGNSGVRASTEVTFFILQTPAGNSAHCSHKKRICRQYRRIIVVRYLRNNTKFERVSRNQEQFH